jgi:hypothetical protein
MFQIAPCTKILCSYMAIRSRGFSGQLFEQDGVGRAVAFEHLERHQILDLLRVLPAARNSASTASLLLPKAGLGLGEEVGQELRMVVTDGVMADGRRQEVAGDQLGALMDQLVEGVLAVGAGSPQMMGPVW